MTLKLSKVARGPHLPTLVASSLSREITQGRLQPGDQLPTEQVLAATFGVSRNVVREAVARLRSEGRVWSQQGRGAFVSEAPQTTVLKIERDESQPGEAFAALFQFRGVLEVQGAALAARLRTEADLDLMRAALASMVGSPYGSTVWLDGDVAFHQAIAGATHNVYVVQVMSFVSNRVRESILAAGNEDHSDAMAQVTEHEHRCILDAIADSDETAARRTMQDHLAGAALRVGLPPAQTADRSPTPPVRSVRRVQRSA